MAITPLYLGANPNDGTGTKARPGGQIINDNFTDLDNRIKGIPYSDFLPMIFGQEYLVPWYDKLRTYQANQSPVTRPIIGMCGDSTTAGTGDFNAAGTIDVMVKKALLAKGMRGLTITNQGQSGKTSEEWREDYLPGEIAFPFDLVCIRYGINDLNLGRSMASIVASFRAALTSIRAAKTPTQLGVVLMSPNNFYAAAVSQAQIDELTTELRNMAREFQCCFIDTRSLFVDYTYYTADQVHVLTSFNYLLSSVIADAIYPDSINTVGSRVHSLASNEKVAKNNTAPNAWLTGREILRAYDSVGAAALSLDSTHYFPYNGALETLVTADGVVSQVNWAFNGKGRAWRNGYGLLWTAWVVDNLIENYANDAAADADATLISGSKYKTTAGGRTVFVKP